MGICNILYDNILVDCDFPKDHNQPIAYLINYDDILYVEFDGFPISDTRTVKDHVEIVRIYLKAGTYVYSFEGKENSIRAGYYEFELRYEDVFAHFIDMEIFSSDADTKKVIEALPKGRYVFIYNNEVYGLVTGMVLMEKEKNSNDNDNNFVSYHLEFETDHQTGEPHLPQKYNSDIEWLMTDHWILWDGWWDKTGIWMNDQIWN